MTPAPELSLWHKRQATLLYHFSSLDYLKGLLPRLDALLQYADDLVEQRKVVDAYMVSERWGNRHTSANWSTCAWPTLAAFRESVLREIADRAHDSYGITGAAHCSRMLDEYSMMWMTHEQEALFKQRFEEVSRYAGEIDGIMMRHGYPHDDYTFWDLWQEYKHLFARLPRFRVHSSIIGQSGQVPPRTGVYIPMDDPHGALQFAWKGSDSASGHRGGKLINSATFNDLGLAALQAVGRKGLWGDTQGLFRFVEQSGHKSLLKDLEDKKITDVSLMGCATAWHSFQYRPCQWYFVELLEGEYEDSDPDATEEAYTGYAATSLRINCSSASQAKNLLVN